MQKSKSLYIELTPRNKEILALIDEKFNAKVYFNLIFNKLLENSVNSGEFLNLLNEILSTSDLKKFNEGFNEFLNERNIKIEISSSDEDNKIEENTITKSNGFESDTF